MIQKEPFWVWSLQRDDWFSEPIWQDIYAPKEIETFNKLNLNLTKSKHEILRTIPSDRIAEWLVRYYARGIEDGKIGLRNGETAESIRKIAESANALLGLLNKANRSVLVQIKDAFEKIPEGENSWLAEAFVLDPYDEIDRQCSGAQDWTVNPRFLHDLETLHKYLWLEYRKPRALDEGGPSNGESDPRGTHVREDLTRECLSTLRFLSLPHGTGPEGPLSVFLGLVHRAAFAENAGSWVNKLAGKALHL